jgi:hypothetical protein
MPKQKSKQKSKKKADDTPKLSLKEQLAIKRKAAKEKQELISYTSSVVLGAALLGGLLFPVGGVKAALGAFGGITCMALSFKYPRGALWSFLVYMPFSGTIVYTLAGGNALFQLAKDGFYIPAAFTIFQEFKRKRQEFLMPKGIKPALFFLLAVCLITLLAVNGAQQFAPGKSGQPIILGLMGLKVLLGYLPLITCGYYLIRNKKELLFLTRMHTVIAIACCVLGFIQYYFLLSGKCVGTRGFEGAALFKATLEARCFVGGALVYSPEVGMIRLPGTFVSPWHWAWFLIGNAFLTFATAFSDPSFLWRIAGMAGMAGVFVNSVISGQRIALAVVPLVIIILLILTGQLANLKRFVPIAIGLSVLAIIAFAMFPDVINERVQSFVDRWNASPPTDFIADQAQHTTGGQKGLFGKGLGRATNSARTFGDVALVETYYPKLIYELGPLGAFGFFALATSLMVATFKIYRSVKEKNLRSFGASFWVMVLLIGWNTYWYPLDTDPVCVYYWFFAGVILKLPEIDKQEQERIAAEEENDPTGKKKRSPKLKSKTTTQKAAA